MNAKRCQYTPLPIRYIGRCAACIHLLLHHWRPSFSYLFGIAEILLKGRSGVLGIVYISHMLIYVHDEAQLSDIYEIFNQRTYQLPLQSKTPVILDLGANNGSSVLYFYQQFPKAKIWAFEPSVHSFQLLQKNIRHLLQNKKTFRLVNKAVVHQNHATRYLYTPTHISTGATLYPRIFIQHDAYTKEKVESDSFSSVMKKLKSINLLKIDIEGGEYDLLPDLLTYSDVIEYAIIELHHAPLKDSSALFADFIKKLSTQYTVEIRQSFNQVQYYHRLAPKGADPGTVYYSVFLYAKSKNFLRKI